MFFKRKKTTTQPSLLDNSLQSLACGKVFAVSLNQNHEFSENDGSEESMEDYLNRNVHETASNESRSLFYFDLDGRHIYPLFSSSEIVQQWINKKPFPWTGATAVTLFEFQTPKLFRHFLGAPPSVIVVLDPMTENERIFSPEEIKSLAQK